MPQLILFGQITVASRRFRAMRPRLQARAAHIHITAPPSRATAAAMARGAATNWVAMQSRESAHKEAVVTVGEQRNQRHGGQCLLSVIVQVSLYKSLGCSKGMYRKTGSPMPNYVVSSYVALT